MKKAINWLWENVLFLETLFILAFVPLFPKLPLLDIKNTWVYIRAEDFIVFFVLISWLILLFKEKITFKTPLTIPILIFWLIGAVATIHGVLLVFPTIANVYPNVAFLSLLRNIEYMSVFFIAFAGIKTKNQLKAIIAVIVLTLLAVIFYGFGQKYFGFPAFLTMNEEFAKGIPIQLSQLSRVPSTFAGHYDLAAYLVLIIPIIFSLIFGFKNWILRIFLLGVSGLGFVLMFMTVSRVSFFVLFIGLFIALFIQKKKLILLSIPLMVVLAVGLLTFQSSLFDRFKSTVSETDVLVDAKTGESLGHVKFVSKEELKDKIVLQRRVKDLTELNLAIAGEDPEAYSTTSAILPYKFIPEEVPLVTAVNVSTGESLGQGTGYVNLYLSPVTKRLGNFYYELSPDDEFKASPSAQILVLHGDFIVKRAGAYDLSFTTRFQGEWPNAIEAFKRNILFGSGYGSVSLAVDNNYLRILAEIGLLGFLSFFMIFLVLGIYIKKVYPDIESKLTKSFIVGFVAGAIGLGLNATLIDVFAASKIAFLLWTLSGITLGLLVLNQKKDFNIIDELKKLVSSPISVMIFLFLVTLVIYSPTLNNYFVGDDFTWLRWAADCKDKCMPHVAFMNYFTNSEGFFYRPGTKIYFYLMHNFFWLNQVVYHLVSLVLHFMVASSLYLLARKILKNNLLAVLSASLFVILSGFSEATLWISSTGHLFAAFFGITGLLSFIYWNETRNKIYYLISVVGFIFALTFHEMAIVFPLFVAAYFVYDKFSLKPLVKRLMGIDFLALFIPVIVYLIMRFLSSSHWLSGDYNYDFIMLPFNFVGNAISYALVSLVGMMALPIAESLRAFAKNNLIISAAALPVAIGIGYLVYKFIYKKLDVLDRKVIVFGLLFFLIPLIPYLGLGNITSRYSYIASFGLILILAVIIKKIYEYFSKSGRELALGVIAIFVTVFVLFQIIQVQQSYFEWKEAGNKAKNFFISFESEYRDSWKDPDVEFHFVNVPLKMGNAWIFPVGINDAVWFALKNDNAKVYTYNDLQTALDVAGYSKSKIVLEFQEDGKVKEIDRFRGVPADLITP